MSWFSKYARSSVGAKHIMAITGLLLFLFALQHMVGHLQMFGGRDMYNAYAHFLQELWEVKWPVRIGLIVILVVHMVVAIGLVAKNRAARPVAYARYKPVISSPVGRAMAWTGLFLFAFLAFHIMHFTVGLVSPEHFHKMDPLNRWDAYSMFNSGFQSPAIYVDGDQIVAVLALHLGHGASSWLQSLGWRHPKYKTDPLGVWVSVVLFLGYMIPPTAVLVGIIRLPGA